MHSVHAIHLGGQFSCSKLHTTVSCYHLYLWIMGVQIFHEHGEGL